MLSKITLLVAIPFVSLIGCGGDDGPKITVKPDAPGMMQFMDAPPATCALNPAVFPNILNLGSTATPAGSTAPGADWYDVLTAGPNMGQTALVIVAGLPRGATDMLEDRMVIEVAKGNAFPLNQAIPLQADATATTYVALNYILGDIVGAGTPSATVTNTYWASGGSVTLTAVSEADNGITTGSVTAVTYHEIDDAGAMITSACNPLPSIVGLNFTLKQTNMAATGKPEGSHMNEWDRKLVMDSLARMHALQATAAAN